MVSVAFAIWPSLNARTPAASYSIETSGAPRAPITPEQQATCQFFGLFDSPLASILHGSIGWGQADDVDAVSGLSEPREPDGAAAECGAARAEISQPLAAGRLRPILPAARRCAGGDLA